MSSLGSYSADVIIAPDVSQFKATAFTKTPEMAEVGDQATLDQLPRIRELLCNLDKPRFGGERRGRTKTFCIAVVLPDQDVDSASAPDSQSITRLSM